MEIQQVGENRQRVTIRIRNTYSKKISCKTFADNSADSYSYGLNHKTYIMSDLAEKLAKLKAQATTQLNECGVTTIDDPLLDKLVNNLRLIVDNKDALLVSGADESELETVRKNFVVKKLGIEDKEKGAAGVSAVAKKMSGIRMKNRAAFYYMVQQELS